jgi:hypothetical protein
MREIKQDDNGLRRDRRLGGVRLVGIFVPWQAVALTLAVVVALTGLAVGRWTAAGEARVHLAATDESTTSTAPAESTTTATELSTTTTTAAASTTTSTVAKATTVTTVKPTTTTTVPPPATCAVIHSTVTGSVSSSWVPSATQPNSWDRHITATVTNPIDQPVVLGYVGTMSTVTSYVFQLAETDGRRLAGRESVTVEDVYTYAGDHTVRGYSPPPDGLYSVEFSPVSAPGLFCRTETDHPGETQGAKRHPPQVTVYCSGGQSSEPGYPAEIICTTPGVFSGLRVHYRLLKSDLTIQEFTVDMGPSFQGDATVSKVDYPADQFAANDYKPEHQMFHGIASLDWNGHSTTCPDQPASCTSS